jgi:hypothetical protein
MKKVLLLGIALLLISSVASAQLPPWGYVGFFADADHTINCIEAAGMSQVHCYLFFKAGSDQLSCVEFSTTVTSGSGSFFLGTTTLNPDIADPKPTGFLDADVLACFSSCYNDWVMFGDQILAVFTVTPVVIEIGAYPGGDWPKLLSCTGGIEYEGKVFTNYYLNSTECGGVAVSESTWGAIKSMYE